MKTLELLRDHNVPCQTEGHKHCRPGWINMTCPFCVGNPGLHLGIKFDGSIATCWRCGWHPIKKVIAKLIGISESEARGIMQQYGGKPAGAKAKEVKRKIRAKAHKLPSDTGPLKTMHKTYLRGRNFDADRLAVNWKLLGTGPISKLDKTRYNHRILAPIFWDRKRVSFQTRDITNKHPAKYMACPEDRELIKHKHVLYGRQDLWGDAGICVEGITDVWRLGKHAAATFGIKYTHKQIRLLSKHFNRVLIAFDDDPQAQEQAKKLKAELILRGVEAVNIELKNDPGSMTPQQAKTLVKKIF